MKQGRTLHVNVLLVDDEPDEVKHYMDDLALQAPQGVAKWWPHGENPIELHFRSLSPNYGETVAEFNERFRKLVACELADWLEFALDLQVAIFDVHFEIPYWPDAGQELAEITRSVRPNVNRALFSQIEPSTFDAKGRHISPFPVSKASLRSEGGVQAFLKEIVHGLSRRFASPFWSALNGFAGTPKAVMHAMAASDSRMTETSVTPDAFLGTFGLSYLQLEGSSTAEPLDSLLSPHSSIADAQNQCARAFGADQAFFVTNGTSTANKIVHTALTSPGDLVFIDRNCHISHHYAMALNHAHTWYLDPFETDVRGVHGGIESRTIAEALIRLLQEHPDKTSFEQARLPKLIALTNCTFDGHICDPASVFTTVLQILRDHGIHERLREIAFLFDEAWYSFGYFHPRFHSHTAMGAANILGRSKDGGGYWEANLRVYVTQSVHKTGGAFRQGSILLARDPLLASSRGRVRRSNTLRQPDANLERRLHQGLLCHTTTSPSLPILASLDVARRQLEFEGCRLVQKALESAQYFRQALRVSSGVREQAESVLSVVEDDELLPGAIAKEFELDPTKVTLRGPLSGSELRKALWSNDCLPIQVNKFADDTVLLMFMPGVTRSWVGHLLEGIECVAAKISEAGKTMSAQSLAIPRDTFYESRYIERYKSILEYPSCIRKAMGLDLYDCLFGRVSTLAQEIQITLELIHDVASGIKIYAIADFIVPYPPGYPILVPGQLITSDMFQYLLTTSHGEIHGLRIHSPNVRSIMAIELSGADQTTVLA